MSGLAEHLQYLTGTREESADRDRRVVDDWASYRSNIKDVSQYLDEGPEEEEAWDSVLAVYEGGEASKGRSTSSILSKLLSKPNMEPLLEPILSILNSSRADDDISGDLAEMVGFDNIELVMDILGARSAVVQQLTEFLRGKSSGTAAPHSDNRHAANQTKLQKVSLDPEDARRRMEEAFRANEARPLFSGVAHEAREILPNVYTSASLVQGNYLSQFGSNYVLPFGTTRHNYETFEEVVIPPAKTVPPRATERLIPVSELDPLAKGSFPGYSSLNRIQSIVYPTAYQSNENILVCAPTGAGKTDVAMLTILRVLGQYRSQASNSLPLAAAIDKNKFKIIYVAPMKALASEIVRKLGKRLQWLSIHVRELTGDMQLSKAEIADTQIIVTTPEKWDVVTRKPTGEGELASAVKLLIIDEVHLLNDERGAVIETIVARTLRQVESTQSVIRIVGLSATLPNYLDVAKFLSVNPYIGLFFFDSSFRPVPLEQHFIGVKGKPNGPQSRKNLDRVTFEKVAELVREDHQVMVFVHARKDTVKTALALREAALADGILDEFSCEDHSSFGLFHRDISQSRNKEMKELFDSGFGIHHAGMLRPDRNMMERMFGARAIKVLCCTATLAWGVNLPAHAVIIKGTQIYDSAKGSFVDLSVLDVLQVFGRAGRPGMESRGIGFICTSEDKLTHYLNAVTSQNPIESRFIAGMIDALNAEISLGTVANVGDAMQWLGYTYLYVRMRKNPLQYGMTLNQLAEDPLLVGKRNQLVLEAATRLAKAGMITYDKDDFAITDLGRIAAKYYIRHASIEIFNEKFKQKMTEADVLAVLSMSTEFDQVKVRDNEVEELENMMESKTVVPCDVKAVKGKSMTNQDKVNILLQGYVSQWRPEDFALVSDQAYVAQNGGRIVRALLEIAISRQWANASAVLMGLSKAIEKRLWPFDPPLKQFNLKQEVLHNLERWADDYTVAELASMTAAELGELVHLNEHHGSAIRDAAKQFPTVGIHYKLRPLGSDVLKIAVQVSREFSWSSKLHGSVEPFWLWVEDHEGTTILQLSHLVFRQSTNVLDVDFIISIPNGRPPPSVTIRFVSDRWIGAESESSVALDQLIMPASSECHSPVLDLPFLPISVVHHPEIESVLSRRLHSLNALQTHAFWSLVKTKMHALLCAPTGSGKSVLGQLMIWETLQDASNNNWLLVVTPRRSIAAELAVEMHVASAVLNTSVEIATSDTLFKRPHCRTIRLITGAELLRAMSRKDGRKDALSSLKLVLCEDLELLDAAYELGVSLLMHATQALPVRFVGLSSSLDDPADLAAWLGVDPLALHSFRPEDRDQSLSVQAQTFTIPHSAALFKAMAKPAHLAIGAVPGDSAIVFVPSQSQCRSVALDLITQRALALVTSRGYLPADVEMAQLTHRLSRLKDGTLADFINQGVGFFHDGMHKADRKLILELFAEGLVRVLIVPRDACWTLPVRAGTVVVMGTQYLHISGDECRLRDYGLEELAWMQGRAVRHNRAGHFHLFCHSESKDMFIRFLNHGLPLESKLLETDVLLNWYRNRRKDEGIVNKQQAVDMLSWTFLSRRLTSNPVYYDCTSTSVNELLSRLVDNLDEDVANG